ncbi:hypothetical protein HMPREF9952_2270 [Haemophilus pittmaniae HK 85]|uniref:Uncharacterized protein n=1 Tax=Haemophilus pittmaniae HK 85 TaxID=1035188 RepID=F9Q6K5_9PAST|nr:hypothetical protein HMPREF9952_2270 [Haemophilus pittmaniae HK 85]
MKVHFNRLNFVQDFFSFKYNPFIFKENGDFSENLKNHRLSIFIPSDYFSYHMRLI